MMTKMSVQAVGPWVVQTLVSGDDYKVNVGLLEGHKFVRYGTAIGPHRDETTTRAIACAEDALVDKHT